MAKNENKSTETDNLAAAVAAESATPATPPAEPETAKHFSKELELFTPFVKWYVGLFVRGSLVRKFENKGEFGEKQNMELQLEYPITFTSPDGEIVSLDAGSPVNVGKVAALANLFTLPVGTLVAIECIGKKEMGRGRSAAWDFKVSYR